MAQYNPNSKYTWTPEDTFELTGRDFGLILNMLRSMLNTEEAAKILLAQQANSAIEAVLARGVEAGHVKEVVEEELSSKDL